MRKTKKISIENEKINDSDDDDEEYKDIGLSDEIIEDVEDIMDSAVNILGTLFKTHKELCLEMANKLISEIIPSLIKDSSHIIVKKIGLLIINKMIEYLGQDILPEKWNDLATTILRYSDHNDHKIRQVAVLGLGNFVVHTKRNFSYYQELVLESYHKVIKMSEIFNNDCDEWIDEKENIWILCSGKDIIWIIGHRSDDRFKLSNNTTDFLTIEYGNY